MVVNSMHSCKFPLGIITTQRALGGGKMTWHAAISAIRPEVMGSHEKRIRLDPGEGPMVGQGG